MNNCYQNNSEKNVNVLIVIKILKYSETLSGTRGRVVFAKILGDSKLFEVEMHHHRFADK